MNELTDFFPSLFKKIIFSWRIIALQCCVGFWHQTVTFIRSFLCLEAYNDFWFLEARSVLRTAMKGAELVYISRSCCSVTKLCPTLCYPMDYRVPGFPVLHYHLEFAQTHVHWVYHSIIEYVSLDPLICIILSLIPPVPTTLSLFSFSGRISFTV